MECPKCKTVIPEGKLYCPSCGYAVQIVPDYDADLEDNLDSASSDIAGTVNRIDVSDSVRTEYDIDATTKEIPMVKKDEASDIKRRTEQDRERSDQITTVIVAGRAHSGSSDRIEKHVEGLLHTPAGCGECRDVQCRRQE